MYTKNKHIVWFHQGKHFACSCCHPVDHWVDDVRALTRLKKKKSLISLFLEKKKLSLILPNVDHIEVWDFHCFCLPVSPTWHLKPKSSCYSHLYSATGTASVFVSHPVCCLLFVNEPCWISAGVKTLCLLHNLKIEINKIWIILSEPKLNRCWSLLTKWANIFCFRWSPFF